MKNEEIVNEIIYQNVNDIKIYPVNYLANEELSDADLNNLLGKDSKNIIYSFIIGMFKYMGDTRTDKQIIDFIYNNDKWYNTISWTMSKRKKFENILTKAYKNIYQYGMNESQTYAEWFTTIYGFSVKRKYK